jgi:internalin A
LVLKGNKARDLAPLATLRKLRSLVLDDTTHVTDLSPLASCTELVEANLSGARARDLSPLSGLKLEVLTLPRNTVADLSPLAEIETLRSLSGYVKHVRDLSPLAKLPLTYLDLTYFERTLDVIAKLTKLEFLGIRYRTVTADLAPLANLASLKSLELNNTPLLDLSPLAGLYNLARLDLSSTGVSNIRPLASLVNLEWLSLRFVRELADITALHGLSKLAELDVVYTSCNRQERARFEKAVPTCRVSPNQNAA